MECLTSWSFNMCLVCNICKIKFWTLNEIHSATIMSSWRSLTLLSFLKFWMKYCVAFWTFLFFDIIAIIWNKNAYFLDESWVFSFRNLKLSYFTDELMVHVRYIKCIKCFLIAQFSCHKRPILFFFVSSQDKLSIIIACI